ncbi:MAG: J domain-containing protein [Cellvibrionaceae bacterium]
MTANTIFFEDLSKAVSPIDLSVTLGLLWMAVCDGSVTIKEQQTLKEYYNSASGNEAFQNPLFRRQAEAALHDENSDVLDQMCKVLKNELNIEEQQYFFQLLINMASAEDMLSVPKNYILRFFLDLFEFELDALNKAFLVTSGALLPELGDPSSPLWWEYEENINGESVEDISVYRENLSLAQARQILGLTSESVSSEVKKAYRRLAQHYHPDRHEGLDEAKQKKAEQSFMLIQQAYEVLKK